ncbi:MAG: hypothetical protein ACYCZW_00220 [Minisyncoccota bacterium]
MKKKKIVRKEGNPKQEFGRLVRSFRDKHHLKREQLARSVGKNLKKGFLNAVEHGCSPTRRKILLKLIDVLRMPEIDRAEAINLLDKFCPQRWKRFKLHSNFTIRTRKLPHLKIRESLHR